MKIVNTMDAIRRNFTGRSFDWNVWRSYAAKISPALAAKCEADSAGYDFERDVLPVIERAVNDAGVLNRLDATFSAVVRQMSANLPILFDGEPQVDIVLYLGLCNGAGWATSLDGRDAILLGVEKIIELDWCGERDLRGLIFHEMGHIWHKIYGRMEAYGSDSPERAALQLYQEGVAMRCEQILAGDDGFFHQDRNGWLAWCRENEPLIRRTYLSRLEDGSGARDFFGDWSRFQGQPDVGYYLGCRFVEELCRERTLREAASLSFDQVSAALMRFLGK